MTLQIKTRLEPFSIRLSRQRAARMIRTKTGSSSYNENHENRIAFRTAIHSSNQPCMRRHSALVVLILIFFSSQHALATPNFIPTASPYHAYIDAKVIFSLEFTAKKEIFL